MQRKSFLLLLTLTALLDMSLQAQTAIPYATTSSQGSTVITNYNDFQGAGPGLAPSQLYHERLSAPPGVPLGTAVSAGTAVNGTVVQDVGNSYNPPASRNVSVTRPTPPPTVGGGQRFVMPQSSGGSAALQGLPRHLEDPVYTFPGLVTQIAGRWVGSDYLYDLPANIGVAVDIIVPEGTLSPIDTNAVKDLVASIFASNGIDPVSEAIGDRPPLPFFHVLIFIQPNEEKYVGYVAGRLFEGVKLFRFDFTLPGTEQAITWEKQELIVTSVNQFQSELMKTISEIAHNFTGRVAYFINDKLEQEDQIRLRCGNYTSSTPRAPMAMPPRKKAPAPQKKAPPSLPALPKGSSLSK